MTQEQWLVYLYGIWPDGNLSALWVFFLFSSVLGIAIWWIVTISTFDDLRENSLNHYSQSPFKKCGKKVYIPIVVFSLLVVTSSLIPNKQTLLYIVATPYLVDSGVSIVQALDNNTSKLYKLNKLLDTSLDKALLKLKGIK